MKPYLTAILPKCPSLKQLIIQEEDSSFDDSRWFYFGWLLGFDNRFIIKVRSQFYSKFMRIVSYTLKFLVMVRAQCALSTAYMCSPMTNFQWNHIFYFISFYRTKLFLSVKRISFFSPNGIVQTGGIRMLIHRVHHQIFHLIAM